MQRIVVGTDGSDGAGVAVAWTAALAAATGAEVVVAACFELEPFDVEMRLEQRVPDGAAEDLAGRWSRPLTDAGVAFDPVVLVGPAAQELERCAKARGADLLVVGARGRAGVAGVLLGSVADQLLHRARRPVAIVPRDAAPALPTRIVLGANVAGGLGASAAWVAELASRLDLPVTTAVAADEVPDAGSGSGPASAGSPSTAPWAERLAERGVASDVVPVGRGDKVAPALVQTAHDVGAELVVVGRKKGRGPLHLRVGGASMHLAHDADDLVVVVVPPP